jgi:predicted nucleotidyltransferase
VTLLETTLRDVARDLEASQVRFALIGGLAVSARAEPRFTRDLDLAVAVSTDREAEDLVRNLIQRGYRVLAQVEQEAAGRLATVRLRPPGASGAAGIVVDLMFASSGIEPELTAAAEIVEMFAGVELPVATVGHLIALKVLSRDDRARPQDRVDLRELLRVARHGDLELARGALARICERGYHRGRDLSRALDELLAE